MLTNTGPRYRGGAAEGGRLVAVGVAFTLIEPSHFNAPALAQFSKPSE